MGLRLEFLVPLEVAVDVLDPKAEALTGPNRAELPFSDEPIRGPSTHPHELTDLVHSEQLGCPPCPFVGLLGVHE